MLKNENSKKVEAIVESIQEFVQDFKEDFKEEIKKDTTLGNDIVKLVKELSKIEDVSLDKEFKSLKDFSKNLDTNKVKSLVALKDKPIDKEIVEKVALKWDNIIKNLESVKAPSKILEVAKDIKQNLDAQVKSKGSEKSIISKANLNTEKHVSLVQKMKEKGIEKNSKGIER